MTTPEPRWREIGRQWSVITYGPRQWARMVAKELQLDPSLEETAFHVLLAYAQRCVKGWSPTVNAELTELGDVVDNVTEACLEEQTRRVSERRASNAAAREESPRHRRPPS